MPLSLEFPPLLDAGFHEVSFDDLRSICVTPFRASRRNELLEKLALFFERLEAMQLIGELWIDGSFMTQKEEPGDVDLVVVLHETSLVSQQQVDSVIAELNDAKARYECDAYWVTNGDYHRNQRAYWRGFFGYQRDETTPKGIAKLRLGQ